MSRDPIHLTPEQADLYLVEVDRHRQRYERALARLVDLGYSERHPFRQQVRDVVLSLRTLCVSVNGMRLKGGHCTYAKRARNWPRL